MPETWFNPMRRAGAAAGVALLAGLGVIQDGSWADRVALTALAVIAFATMSGWVQLLFEERPAERGFGQVKNRSSRAWLLVTTAVVIMASLAVQTWFRPGTTLAGGDDVVPNGTAWIGRLFEPWIWGGSTFGEPSQLPMAVPKAAIFGLVHAFGGDPGIAHRILETVLFAGAGLGALGLLASLRIGPVGAFVGATVYLFNPYVFTWVSPHDVYLAAYGALPAIPAAIVAAGTGQLSVRWSAVLVGAAAPLIGYVFFNPPLVGLIIAATLTTPLVVAWVEGKHAGARSLRALLLAIPLLIVTSAYWTVPAIVHLSYLHLSPFGGVSGFSWIAGELRTTIRNALWLNTRWLWIAPEYFPYAKAYDALPLSALRFVMPALAFSALALPRVSSRDRRSASSRRLRLGVLAATAALFVIFISTGTRPPGNVIFEPLYGLPFGWLLQEPERFIILVALSYAVLTAIVVESLLDHWSIDYLMHVHRLTRPILRLAVVPLAVITAVAVGFPLYSGALVPDSGRPLPIWANHARPQHIQMPAYWSEMARVADSLPIQGSLLVMPPDDFYEMPYTWYYGSDSFIVDLFQRHVLVPSAQGVAPASSELMDAVNLTGQSLLRREWGQAEVLVTALNAPLVLVRRDIVAPFANHTILPPNELATALDEAPNFVLIQRIGSLDLFGLRNRVTEMSVGSNFVTISSRTPDLRLLSILPPNTALVSGEAASGVTHVVQGPPWEQWGAQGDTLSWQPSLPPGRTYRIADLQTKILVPLDRTGTFIARSSTAVSFSTASDRVTAISTVPGARAALSNGDFTEGPWGPLADCHTLDALQVKPSLGATVMTNGAPGGLPALRLMASLGNACVNRKLDWRGGSLLLSIMVHHVEGAAPRVCVWQTGPNRCAPLPSMPDTNDWVTYRAQVTPDAKTTAVSIYLYADASQGWSPTTSDYAHVQVIEVPSLPSFVVVYSPNIATVSVTGRIAISNGDFTDGVWGPVDDCYAVNPLQAKRNLNAAVLPDAAPGARPALQLSASIDSACEQQSLDWHGGSLLINVTVKHVRGAAPRICLWETGPDRCATLPSILDAKDWSTYRVSVSPDAGTSALKLYLYADSLESGGPTINQYAGVEVVELPALSGFAALADPDNQSAFLDQLVVADSSFSTEWQGPPHSSHVLVDGMLNGWLIPRGSSFSARYEPADIFRVAVWSSLTVYAVLLLIAFLALASRLAPRPMRQAVRTIVTRRRMGDIETIASQPGSRQTQAPRIAVLIDRLRVGGVEKTAIEEVRGLRDLGIEATLVVLKRDEAVPDAFSERLSGIKIEYLDDRLPGFLRTSWKIPGFYFFSFFHVIYALALPLRIKAGEWDVILSHNSFTTFTAWTLWRTRHIPYCMFVWDPTTSILVRAYQNGPIRLLRPILVPIGRMLDRVLARGGRHVIVGSHTYVTYLRGLLPPDASLTIAPPGCFPVKSPRKEAGEYLLAATSWKDGKQLEVLLKALAVLPGAKLVVAGRWMHPNYRARIDALTNRLGLVDRIRFTDELADSDLTALARGALCAVTVNAEFGFGMPALEAAAQACTFVCPRSAGIASYFASGLEAFYFDEGDSDGLVRVLRQLIDDPDLAMSAGLAAWKRARSTLTWAHHADAVARASGVSISASAQP